MHPTSYYMLEHELHEGRLKTYDKYYQNGDY